MGSDFLMEKFYRFPPQHLSYEMKQLLSLVPEAARSQVKQLLQSNQVVIKITKKRKTKHGDFRRQLNGVSLITINTTPNPYRFLITLLHELAHYDVVQAYGTYQIKPHGAEWKAAFRKTLLPFLNSHIFPEPICGLLALHMKNPRASTDRDFKLVMALRKYDLPSLQIPVFKLQEGQRFMLDDGRIFVKSKKRRTRFECNEIASGKTYLFSPHAEVTLI